MRELTVENRHPVRKLNLALLRRLCRRLLDLEPLASRARRGYALYAAFLDAPAIAEINRSCLRHEGPTDVIALDYAPEGGGWLGGEIFVCLDVAAEQAPRYGASYPEEIVRCLSHGLLHLAGWDDQTPEQARRMEAVQERLLSELRSRFNLEKLVPGEASER